MNNNRKTKDRMPTYSASGEQPVASTDAPPPSDVGLPTYMPSASVVASGIVRSTVDTLHDAQFFIKELPSTFQTDYLAIIDKLNWYGKRLTNMEQEMAKQDERSLSKIAKSNEQLSLFHAKEFCTRSGFFARVASPDEDRHKIDMMAFKPPEANENKDKAVEIWALQLTTGTKFDDEITATYVNGRQYILREYPHDSKKTIIIIAKYFPQDYHDLWKSLLEDSKSVGLELYTWHQIIDQEDPLGRAYLRAIGP